MERRFGTTVAGSDGDVEEFERFVDRHGPRLRRALGASFGATLGAEACAAALSWAWETWPRADELANPVGYLVKVGRSSLRLDRVKESPSDEIPDELVESHHTDPDLVAALDGLTEQQRSAVVLVHGFGWTLTEAAEALDVEVSTIRNHVRRALVKLHAALEEAPDAGTR
jgi:RNA polymerase sigma factor (sigma-70 family)